MKKILIGRLVVLITTLFLIQIFPPVVYSYFSKSVQANEFLEIPVEIGGLPTDNSLSNDLEKKDASPLFSFNDERIENTIAEVIFLSINANQMISDVIIELPDEALIIKDQMDEDIFFEETIIKNKFRFSFNKPKNSFKIPLVFKEVGSYEILIEEAKIMIEIKPLEDNIEPEQTLNEDSLKNSNIEKKEEKNDINSVEPHIQKNPSYDPENYDYNTIVESEDFLNFFDVSGGATYNKENSVITLTQAINNQTGSFYLKNRIDSHFPFQLKGKVYLGANNNSADGIGLGFHKDEAHKIGLAGSGFGLAGLSEVFGFKLDTFYNHVNNYPFRPDPVTTGAFGSFVYMDNSGWFTSYTGSDAPARSISRPSNVWRDILITLDSNRILKVEFENIIWEKELPENLTDQISFLVSASTGTTNAHQAFMFESFKYSRSNSKVIVNYIDDLGYKLYEPKVLTGLVGDTYQTEPKNIKNYAIKETPQNSLGVFTEETQVVNYVYTKVTPSVINPLDPLDPETEVDPENKPDLPEEQGLLSIDFISPFNFGTQAISVHDQTYYAQPQRLLNEDGTVNETEERPNYVQISDRRPANDRNGWQLAVTQNAQFTATNNRELNGARLRLTNQQLATAQGGSAPVFQQTTPLPLVPGTRRILLMAQGTEGTGTWIYRFGDQETANKSVALDVPKGANPEATRYETTLTWELSAVPDN